MRDRYPRPPMDVVDLREFYASRFGIVTRRMIMAGLRPRLGEVTGRTVLGLGFAQPYLDEGMEQARRVLSFMLARQGVIHWPEDGLVRSALVDEFELPLLESSVDLAIVAHGLELSDSPEELLQEVWRVLAPQGRLLLVVPNRRGMWARFDSSPFGHGQPFSRPQLTRLLRETQFSLNGWSQALYFPPLDKPFLLAMARALDGAGRRLMPALSGVVIVEAVKQVYAISSGKRVRRLVPRLQPGLKPLPAPGG
jgi:SAM-dependent methyltransferase